MLGLQAPQQQVQVDEALEGLPSGEDPLHTVVVERFQEPEPALQVVARADVVARKHVQASETAQQDVFRGPAADTAQGAQPRHGRRIVEVLEVVEIDLACSDGARERDDRLPLLPAEAEHAQLVRRALGEVVRRREGVSPIACCVPTARAGFRQPVEQLDTQAERDLLAGHGIDQRLEHGREARRLQAVEELRQSAEGKVALGRAIEVIEGPIDAEQTDERRHRHEPGARREARAAHRRLQHRTLRWRDLHDLDAERALVDDQHPAIGGAIPAIDGVDRPPAQRLDREVEAKRRHRLDLERQPFEIRGRPPDLPTVVNAQILHP